MTKDYRIESDTLGEVKVPKDALWGAQTERSRHNFPTGPLMPVWVMQAARSLHFPIFPLLQSRVRPSVSSEVPDAESPHL